MRQVWMAMLMEEYDECWAAAKTNTKAPLNVPRVEVKGESEGESVGERRCKGAGGEAEAKRRQSGGRSARGRAGADGGRKESQKPEVRAGAGERAGAYKLGQEHRQERGQAQMQA